MKCPVFISFLLSFTLYFSFLSSSACTARWNSPFQCINEIPPFDGVAPLELWSWGLTAWLFCWACSGDHVSCCGGNISGDGGTGEAWLLFCCMSAVVCWVSSNGSMHILVQLLHSIVHHKPHVEATWPPNIYFSWTLASTCLSSFLKPANLLPLWGISRPPSNAPFRARKTWLSGVVVLWSSAALNWGGRDYRKFG